jgi:amphi-Trp domain-containing protein
MDDEATVYESEMRADRATVAAFLRELADGIERGRIVLGDDEDRVEVEPPEDLELEVEVELGAGRDDRVESSIEVEISWSDAPRARRGGA